MLLPCSRRYLYSGVLFLFAVLNTESSQNGRQCRKKELTLYSGTSMHQRTKGVAKYVYYIEVLSYRFSFSHILPLLGQRILFVIQRSLLNRGLLNQGFTVL